VKKRKEEIMRMTTRVAIGLLITCWALGQTPERWTPARASDVEPQAAVGFGALEPRVAMWIWTNAYTYRAGDPVTLRWTVKTNGDLYPYTVVAYRQNNQTGVKTYLPGGAEPGDTSGNKVADGLQPVRLRDVSRGVLLGSGGALGEALAAPNELGMHTFVVQLRDYTGARVLKAAYMKIGIVSEQVTVSGAITADTAWVNTKSYLVSGIVPVRNNAVLTIEPGTFVYGAPGSQPPSVLLVTRNGRINASGTRSRPIVMTSSQPFGQRKRGDWGGLILLGKAPINVGANTAGNTNAAGTFYIEGLNATDDGLYGGDDPNHNCGTLRYVRVEFAGSTLSPNNETNAFTWGGCGKATVADHLQASYGLDDSFEWFGGNMDAKYLVGGLGADDFVDFQLGYTGRVQYGVFYQSPDQRGNRGIEGDNSEYDNGATPYSHPTLFNLTFIGSGQPGFDESNSPGLFLRRGARASLNNIVVQNFYSAAVDLNDANTQAQMDAGNITMNGVLIWSNNLGAQGAATLQGQITNAATLAFAQGTRGQGNARNFLIADPQMRRIAEFSDPNWTGLFGSPIFRTGWVAPPDDGFFDQSATFVGGIGDENWMEEWTSFLVEADIA
jgi:hypothetical protein